MLHHHPIAFGTAFLCVPVLFAQKPDHNPEQLLVKGNGYELYGMPGKDLSADKEQMDFAVSRFKSLFGIDPPTMAVVFCDSPERMNAFDDSALKARGLVIQLTLDNQAVENIHQETHVIAATGWVLKSQNRIVQVDSTFPSPGGEASSLQAGDILKRFGGKAVDSAMQVGEAYDALPAGADFPMEIQRGNQTLSLNLKKGMAVVKTKTQGQQIPQGMFMKGMPMTEILAHESMHLFCHGYANRILGKPVWWGFGSGSKSPGQGPAYGHPQLPDWFDEAVGTWSSRQEVNAHRWAWLKKQPSLPIPLEKLFTMEHPGQAQMRQERKDRAKNTLPGPSGGDKVQFFSVSVSGDTPPGVPLPGAPKGLGPNPEEAAFYPESMAFLTYLHEKEGPAFLRATLESLLKGQSMSEVIQKGKSIPKDMESLTKDFQAFIAKRNPAS